MRCTGLCLDRGLGRFAEAFLVVRPLSSHRTAPCCLRLVRLGDLSTAGSISLLLTE